MMMMMMMMTNIRLFIF